MMRLTTLGLVASGTALAHGDRDESHREQHEVYDGQHGGHRGGHSGHEHPHGQPHGHPFALIKNGKCKELIHDKCSDCFSFFGFVHDGKCLHDCFEIHADEFQDCMNPQFLKCRKIVKETCGNCLMDGRPDRKCMRGCFKDNVEALEGCRPRRGGEEMRPRHDHEFDSDDDFESDDDDESDESDDDESDDDESDDGEISRYGTVIDDDFEHSRQLRRRGRGRGGRGGKDKNPEELAKKEACKGLITATCNCEQAENKKMCMKECFTLDSTKEALEAAGCKGRRGQGGKGNKHKDPEKIAKKKACKDLITATCSCGQAEKKKKCMKECFALDSTKEALEAADCKLQKKKGKGRGGGRRRGGRSLYDIVADLFGYSHHFDS